MQTTHFNSYRIAFCIAVSFRGFKSPALDGFSEESIKALTLPDDFSVYVIAFGKHAKLGNMFEVNNNNINTSLTMLCNVMWSIDSGLLHG